MSTSAGGVGSRIASPICPVRPADSPTLTCRPPDRSWEVPVTSTGRDTEKTGQICLREKPSVSDLESSSLAGLGGFIRVYSVKSVPAPLIHRFLFVYSCAGITFGQINARTVDVR